MNRPWEDADRLLADRMASYWVNFITRGDPNGPGLPEWPSDSEHILRLGLEPRADVALPADKAAVLLQRFAALP